MPSQEHGQPPEAATRPKLPLAGWDVVILVGGQGTRLREVVSDVPKPLVPVCGRPFLFYVLDALAIRGAQTVTLCVGHLAQKIVEAVGEEWLGLPVNYSQEDEPLGTAGALGKAWRKFQWQRVVVMNGDTWFEPPWRQMLDSLEQGPADGVVAATEVPDAGRYGLLRMDERRRITGFEEKREGAGAGWINAGIYAFKKSVLKLLPQGAGSLEKDVLPLLAAEGALFAAPGHGEFLDFGTPDDYQRAGGFIKRLGLEPHPMFPEIGPDRQMPLHTLVKPGAGVVIEDEQGRVLLDKRSDCGLWCIFGGGVDAGETAFECALRETEEETGLRVKPVRFVGVFSHPRWRTVKYPDRGDLRQLYDSVMLVRPCGRVPRVSSESFELAWFTWDDLPLAITRPAIQPLRAAALETQPVLW